MTEEQFLVHIDHIGRIYEATKEGIVKRDLKASLDGLQELRNIACEFAQKLEGRQAQGWVSVKDAPLVTWRGREWQTVNDVSFQFLAAVPLKDNKWWIRQCVINDGVGLCVMDGDEFEAADWSISDVTHYSPITLPSPPQQ